MADFTPELPAGSHSFDGRMHIGNSVLRVGLVIIPEEPSDGAPETERAAYEELQVLLAQLGTAGAVQLDLHPYEDTPELPPGVSLVETGDGKIPAVTDRSLASHLATMDAYADGSFSRRIQIASVLWTAISRNMAGSRGIPASPWQGFLAGSDRLPQLNFDDNGRLQYVPVRVFREFTRAAIMNKAVGPNRQRILESMVHSLEEAGLIQPTNQREDERN